MRHAGDSIRWRLLGRTFSSASWVGRTAPDALPRPVIGCGPDGYEPMRFCTGGITRPRAADEGVHAPLKNGGPSPRYSARLGRWTRPAPPLNSPAVSSAGPERRSPLDLSQ